MIVPEEENMQRILIVDDDDDLSLVISDMLEKNGYDVGYAADGIKAKELLKEEKFHLVLLDINLPDSTGFELCQELRSISKVPIIFISARVSEPDKINGLDIGGDDYITKPLSLKELLSRVNALIRRTYGYSDKSIAKFGNVTINLDSRTVTRHGEEVLLTQREFDLLAYLLKNKNKAISKEQILNDVWGTYAAVVPATLTVHIRWLRMKLEDDPAVPEFIKTVYKVGYMLEVPE